MRCDGAADEDDSLSQNIPVTICKVMYFPARIAIQRIHREVAAHGVGLPVVGELHLRAAAIGLDIMAQRRDFIGVMIGNHRHRAMLDAGGMHAQCPRPCKPPSPARAPAWWRYRFRPRALQQRIAHRTSGHARFTARLRDGREHPLQRWRLQPLARASEGSSRHGVHRPAHRDCGSCPPWLPRYSAS